MHYLFILVILYIATIHCNTMQYFAQFKVFDGEFKIKWSSDFEKETIKIELCKHSNNEDLTTLIGIGFSNHGKTENADVLVVDILRFKSHDMHTDDKGQLAQDREKNYQIIDISPSSNRSCFTFQRQWNTCDKNDYVIDRGTTNILMFTSTNNWFNTDGMILSDFDPVLEFLQLIRSTIPVNIVDDNTQTVDIVVGMREIANDETTYWCKVIQLPDFMEKNHIIRYEAIITESSRGIVHHMELFHCIESPSPEMGHYNAPCNSETKPMGLTMCRKVIAAWAMGAGPFTYPENVGNPIGGPDYVPYAILEIHYNNPQKLSGILDNSGMRLYYTPQLRRFDAGIIELGLEYVSKNSIPPRSKHFDLSGYCVEKCLKEALPKNGIFVFGSQLHTHLTGTKVVTRHFRNNRELLPLNIDEHYQPHYQEIRLLPEIVNILPGDALVTTCTYKTTNRTEMTLGGIAITDEMCLNYIFYYPRTEFELCKSSVSDLAVELFLRKPLTNLRETFNDIEWTKEASYVLSEFYKTAPIHQSCNKSDSQSYPGEWNYVQTIEIDRQTINENKIQCLKANMGNN